MDKIQHGNYQFVYVCNPYLYMFAIHISYNMISAFLQ